MADLSWGWNCIRGIRSRLSDTHSLKIVSPMRCTKFPRPKPPRIDRLCLMFIAGFCIAGCSDTRPRKMDLNPGESTATDPEDQPATSTPTSASSSHETSSYPGSSTADSGTKDSSGDATTDTGDVTSSQEPDTDFPKKLEGLDLDLSALPNYQAQELPLYVNHDNSPEDNPITDKGATLGRVLFYDPRLSTNNKISCASCHRQDHAFGDPRPLSDGVAGQTLRHSMRLINLRFSEDFHVRWDRKAESVEVQMLMPIQDHVEMGYSGKDGNPNLDDLVKKLQAISEYKVLFRLAWGDETVSKERIAKALAQFVRSIQSFDSKYDLGRVKVAGEHEPFPNFSEDENAGKLLFLRNFDTKAREVEIEGKDGSKKRFEVSQRVSGGFNCSACHRPPEFDIDPRSRNNGLTQVANPKGSKSADYEAVRSPSLRDLVNPRGELNGGPFHIGQAKDLSGIAAHYDFQPPDENNYLLDRRFTRRDRPVHLNITPTEERQLSAFLRTLSGRKVYTDKRWSNPFTAR